MEENSTGATAPAVEQEQKPCLTPTYSSENAGGRAMTELDRDLLCPICIQIIKDAFLTVCGHSFCYMCIITHLRNKSDCPCCGHNLTSNKLFPNFVLNKLLIKASAHQISKGASPVESFCRALQQGCEVTVKELDTLLVLLAEKKKKMEQEEAERNMQILLDFLEILRRQKVEELNETHADLGHIREDIDVVERRRIELYRAKEKYSAKLRMLGYDATASKPQFTSADQNSSGFVSRSHLGQAGVSVVSFSNKKLDKKTLVRSHGLRSKDAFDGSDSEQNCSSFILRKKRVDTQFDDLQECYMQKRRHAANELNNNRARGMDRIYEEGYNAGLASFQSVLTTITQYSQLRVTTELRHGDIFPSANIVSSIEFDRDDELFATAGVSRRIKVFGFSSVVNETEDMHSPVVDMSSRSKLSCLSWNKFAKNQIASSDYEGMVTVWDIDSQKGVVEYEEHEKRAWSVDFSCTEPSMLVSGSDDCKVKIWSTKQETSVININMKANICCVKYNPGSSIYVAVGSADHHIHYYDLRMISQPLHVFSGHKKAVSYVKFLSGDELASASTDSTLRLWDVKENLPVRTLVGHTNEKNFVGLSVNSEYIACGSETNEVFVYHKEICRPLTRHKFGAPDLDDTGDDATPFISAVCWKSDGPTLLAANSRGIIKVLVLAA